MDYKRVLILVAIIVLGLVLKANYERKNTGQPRIETPAVKGVSDFFGKKVQEGEETLQEVLGETTSFVAEQASKSASAVTAVILEKSSEKIVEQIKKLPEESQKEVKNAVCQ